jgi:hypothetical protein
MGAHSLDQIIAIEPKTLAIMVLIVSIQTVGIVQWTKNFIKCNKECRNKKYAVISLIVLIPSALANTTLVPSIATAIYDVVFLGLAVTQLAWDVLLKGVPSVVNALFDKAASIKLDDLRASGNKTES